MLKHKLGLLPPRHDSRDLLFSDYKQRGAVIHVPTSFGLPIPPTFDWLMLGNGPDSSVMPDYQGCGNCFWAGRAHGTWATEIQAARSMVSPPLNAKDVIGSYSKACGYQLTSNPDNPTDVGTDPRKGLSFCRKTGLVGEPIGLSPNTHKIAGYVAIEPGNWEEILEALYLFGTVGLGFEIPDYAELEFETRRRWTVRSGGQIEGGHWVEGVKYDAHGLWIVTWGAAITVSKSFIERYCAQPFAILSEEFLHAGRSPYGFNLDELKADLVEL